MNVIPIFIFVGAMMIYGLFASVVNPLEYDIVKNVGYSNQYISWTLIIITDGFALVVFIACALKLIADANEKGITYDVGG